MDEIAEKDRNIYQQALSASEQGHYRQSAQYCWQLLKKIPYHPGVMNLLAINYHFLKKFKSATLIYQIASKHSPQNLMLINNQGGLHRAQGNWKAAIEAYRSALSLAPKEPAAYFNLALVYQAQGEWLAALECYEHILRLEPTDQKALLAVAKILQRLKQYRIAMNAYQKILQMMPGHQEALLGIGICLQEQGLHRESMGYYQSLIQRYPHVYAYQANLAVAHKQIGDYDEAIRLYQAVLEKAPDLAYIYTNLGNAYCGAERYQEAIEVYQLALDKQPHSAEAYNGIGYAYYALGEVSQAETYYQEAIAIEPTHVEAHFNQAIAYLAKGNYRQGWPAYEWRLQKPELKPLLSQMTAPRWQGESLEGKTLLILSEQGFGDTLQFMRFLPLIAKSKTRVILLTSHALEPLFQNHAVVDQVITQLNDRADSPDYYLPLLSLPTLFECDNPSFFRDKVPYIKAQSLDNAKKIWPQVIEKFQSSSGLKVGLSWQGSLTNKKIRHRSMRINDLLPLLSMKDIHFFSLQKSHDSATVLNQYGCTDLSPLMTDFGMSTALISALDLVITIDTALAHLVGAMGKPVWTLLCARPDWRWRGDGLETDWYPTMRLYRQQVLDDWHGVIANVVQDLAKERR